MQFDYYIEKKDGIITIIPYTDSEVEVEPDNFDIKLDDFYSFVQKNELNTSELNYNDPSKHDGHGQISIKENEESYFLNGYSIIKSHIQKYLTEKNLL
jgi:hypothetical protein